MTKKRHRRHSIPFKRMIVEAYLNGAALKVVSKIFRTFDRDDGSFETG